MMILIMWVHHKLMEQLNIKTDNKLKVEMEILQLQTRNKQIAIASLAQLTFPLRPLVLLSLERLKGLKCNQVLQVLVNSKTLEISMAKV